MFSCLTTCLFSLFSLTFVILFICFKWISSLRLLTKKNLPPFPTRLPVIGNLHQLAGSSSHRSLWALSQKHGPLMFVHFGSVPVLVASSSETAKEILKTHDLNFSDRPKSKIANILVYGSKGITFSPYGEHWRHVKGIVVNHLLNSSRVQSFQHVREKEINLMIEKIEKRCDSVVDISEICFRLVNNIVCKVSLGKTYGEQKFKDLLKRFVHVLGCICIGSYIPWLSWIDRLSGLADKAEKVAKEFDAFFESVIEEHEYKRQRMDGQSDGEKDLVDILLSVQRDDAIGFTLERDTIKAIILDVFAAGTDTIFASLVWSLSELIRHPRVMKKLQQEATEIAQGGSMIFERDLKNMHYLKAIIKETLRLYPPGPLLSLRKSRQDVKLMGYDIPSGTQTIVNAWAIGRDPTVWEEPEKFWPERFLNNCIDYKGLHFEMLPFGAGRRGCPGIQFAIAIYELALANVVYKFDLTLPNGVRGEDLDMSETNSITLHKRSPLLVMATPRF